MENNSLTRAQFVIATGAAATSCALRQPLKIAPVDRIALDGDWFIQAAAGGDWHRARIPSTVLAALVENGKYPDPYVGMRLRDVPGASYPIGDNFANLPMPSGSPFRASWWHRKQFDLPPHFSGKYVALHFGGFNYRANIWLNGVRIADAKHAAGMWRAFEFDVTSVVHADRPNILKLEVFAPQPDDLALTFVDWNPMPPDKCMGIFREVSLSASGPLQVRNVQVVTRVDASRDRAHLTVYGDISNLGGEPIDGTLRARIGQIAVARTLHLAPNEKRTENFSPDEFPQLTVDKPQLWWPWQLGAQPLHELDVEIAIGAGISDHQSVRFGIREITSAIDGRGHRLFKINGERLQVLGAGWTPDMLLRESAQRQEDEIRYVRDMRLNTIRLEGKILSDSFFETCDRHGILVMAGWCCCDRWEHWDHWTQENYQIAAESLRTQLRRLRNHACMLVWLYGSDNAPPRRVEEMYMRVLRDERWPNPELAAASAQKTLAGPTGVKMTGPYDYVGPSYWLEDRENGGAFGFNSETSPGPAVPPVESLRRFLPTDHLWPIDEVWNYHAGGGEFRTLDTFTKALEARYGAAGGVDDYATKAQLMTYEGQRAMFEAFRRNKYVATGVIQWMLNNAWPGLIWHLYDYYLRPAGGYFGTKKACEPLHVMYSYDDRSIVVVNDLRRSVPDCHVEATVYDHHSLHRFSQSVTLAVPPDSSTRVFHIPEIADLTKTYFIRLELRGAGVEERSNNFYLLSTQPETFDWNKSTWYYTPLKTYADFTGLAHLPKTTLSASASSVTRSGENTTTVMLTNSTSHIAYFVHLAIRKGEHGDEVLPVLWDDNYVSLAPGERQTIRARYRADDLQSARPWLEIEGWNISKAAHRAG